MSVIIAKLTAAPGKAQDRFALQGFQPLARDRFGGRHPDFPSAISRIFNLFGSHRSIESVACERHFVPGVSVVAGCVEGLVFFLVHQVFSISKKCAQSHVLTTVMVKSVLADYDFISCFSI